MYVCMYCLGTYLLVYNTRYKVYNRYRHVFCAGLCILLSHQFLFCSKIFCFSLLNELVKVTFLCWVIIGCQ